MSITPTTQPPADNRPLTAGRPDGHYGYGGYNQGLAPYGAPYGPYGPTATGPAGNVDLLGAVMRRKFVVILLALIGGGLGYLYFSKTPETYQSALKIQITSQSPPSIVDGEVMMQKASAGRHLNLIASHLVLREAIEKYNQTLKESAQKPSSTGLFATPEETLSNLLKRFSVSVDKESDETLMLSLSGPDQNELPDILLQIVDAYSDVLSEDNKAVGEESIGLIAKLQEQMLTEKSAAEERYLKLIKEVGVEPTGSENEVVNPHAVKLAELMQDQKSMQDELRSVIDKLQLAKAAIDTQDETSLQVLAIDAQKYLGVDHWNRNDGYAEARKNDNYAIDMRLADQKVDTLKQKLADLQFGRQELLTVHGPGHRRIKMLDNQIDYYTAELRKAIVEKDELVKLVEQQKADENSAVKVDWEQVRAQTERKWIDMYLTALERDRQSLTSTLAFIEEELVETRQRATKVAGDVVELKILQRQIEEKREAIRLTLDRLSELNILSSNYSQTKVRVLDPPGTGQQIDPSLPKSLGIGIFLGALLGAGLALLIDRADHLFRSPHEIFQLIGAPVLGRIPRIRLAGRKGATDANLITAHQTNSGFTEAFRAARTGLFFASQAENMKVLLCTSPSPGDGKSTTVSNLALSMAQAGKKVLLIDADFRRPRVDKYFGIDGKPGALDYLSGDVPLSEVLRESHQDNLWLLTTGGRPKNPGELVASKPFLEMLDQVKDQFDYVLIDSPPILPVADPCVIATHVDGVLMVLRIRKGVKVTAQKAKESLNRVGAKVVGILVNGVDENPHYNEYGYYGYQYTGGRYTTYNFDKGYADYQDKIPAKSGE